MKERAFWPCTLVDHEGGKHSIVFSDFALTASHFTSSDGGGYAVAKLVRSVAVNECPGALERVKFDPEASMFAAYGRELDALLAIANVLRGLCDVTEEQARVPTADVEPAVLEALLERGYVVGLSAEAQAKYEGLMPDVPASAAQHKCLEALTSDQADERFRAARRINSDACEWAKPSLRYLKDPRVTSELGRHYSAESDEKVRLELLRALCHIVERHFADLRLKGVFEGAMGSRKADHRLWGVLGATTLHEVNWDLVESLASDRSKKVRDAVARGRNTKQG